MGEAAKISLKAIGKQDTHLLSKDPEDSFFNYKNDKIHSTFENIIEVVILLILVLFQVGHLVKLLKCNSIHKIWVIF